MDGVDVPRQALGAQGADGCLLADDQHIRAVPPGDIAGRAAGSRPNIPKVARSSLAIPLRGFWRRRQGLGRGGALGDLAHPHMRLARGEQCPDFDQGQIGLDELRPAASHRDGGSARQRPSRSAAGNASAGAAT